MTDDEDLETELPQIIDWLLVDLWQSPRCVCFEGGTFCCVDCAMAGRLRAVPLNTTHS